MAKNNVKSDSLPADLVPIALRSIEERIEEASTQSSAWINARLALVAEGNKLANNNFESAMAVARVSTDCWKKLAESTVRSNQLAVARWFDIWRSMATVAAVLDSQIKSVAEASVPSVLAKQAALVNKTLLNATQGVTRKVIDPIVELAAKARSPKAGSNGEARDPSYAGGFPEAEAHA